MCQLLEDGDFEAGMGFRWNGPQVLEGEFVEFDRVHESLRGETVF